MNVWQIATGEPGRDFRKIFFDHDIMILGPSHSGCALQNNYDDGIPNSKGNQVNSFAKRPQEGDVVLMRFAQQVIGIGLIPDGDEGRYFFNDKIGKVYGWDLYHCRRVLWASNYPLGALADVFRGAKQKPSFTQIHEDAIHALIRSIDLASLRRPLKQMPEDYSIEYSEEELGINLFGAGVSNNNVQQIISALEQAERLCSWYWSSACGRKPSENEVISHVVLPFFLSLGWSHQQMAVEWGNVDMACFRSTPTTPDRCVIVVEAKGLGQPLEEAFNQAKEYVAKRELKSTQLIVTTDGASLFLYQRSGSEWSSTPFGYIDMCSWQKRHILPEKTDLIATVVKLLPASLV